MSVIEVKKVSKWFGEVSALSEVDLQVDYGILGLLGPNGAGKSTLLKLMSGQLVPSLGEVLVLGRDFQDQPDLYAEIGLCPEQDSLWEEFNGPQFLSAMLRLSGWLKHDADKRAKELIGLMQLDFAGKRRVGGYSKGMRQKLRIAQSFAHNPKVLFLDEPMTGLDASSRALIGDIIRDMGDKGKTILVSSHILHEVEALTKEMVVISQGRVRARGNVYEIRDLLTNHPLQLEMQVNDSRKLSRALLDFEHVVRLELDPEVPGKLVVYTKHQNRFFEDLPEVLERENIDIYTLQAEDEDMESVFKYLVN